MNCFSNLLIVELHIFIINYVLGIIYYRVINTNVLSVKETLSKTHVRTMPHATFLRSRAYVCVFLCSCVQYLDVPHCHSLSTYLFEKSISNTFISYFRDFTYFKRGINTVVNSAIRHWYFTLRMFRNVL